MVSFSFLQVYIQRLVEDTAQQLPGAINLKKEAPVAAPEPVLGATARAWAVRRWNEVSSLLGAASAPSRSAWQTHEVGANTLFCAVGTCARCLHAAY